jgi:hypothetical protein
MLACALQTKQRFTSAYLYGLQGKNELSRRVSDNGDDGACSAVVRCRPSDLVEAVWYIFENQVAELVALQSKLHVTMQTAGLAVFG